VKGFVMTNKTPRLPHKSVAVALLFTVLLGPVGLLYSSFWGGFLMIFVMLVVMSNKFFFPALLSWLICCIWGVGAVEKHNRALAEIPQKN
jgi:hypothetical protein